MGDSNRLSCFVQVHVKIERMVKNLFSLLTIRQTSILSGASIIMATVLLTKILGLVRDRLLAHVYSPDQVAIFFAAFRIPDLIFSILVFGALSVAFIPIFTEYREREGKEEAFRMAQSILNISLVTLSLVGILTILFITPLTEIIVPGFTQLQKQQVADLTRVILIGQVILTVGSLFVGILQSFQRFIIPALAGVFYNLGIIIGIIFLNTTFGVMAPAYGVIIGASMHALIQLPLTFSLGFRFNITCFFHPGVKGVLKLVSVRTIGLAAEQVNDTVAVILASIISTASVTYLTFSQHLQLVPVSLFGATIAQAALPVLSSERARGRTEEFKVTLLTTMHQILFLALPATAILIVLRIPAVRLVFGASQFDWESTVLTGQTLAFMSIGLAAQAVSLLLVRSFYALKDTKTPVLASLGTVTLNISLSVYFVKILGLGIGSLGFAFSISNLFSSVILFIALHFKTGGFNLNKAIIPFSKMLLATVIMGMALYIPIKLLDQVIFDTTRTINLLFLTGMASLFALAVYIGLVRFMEVKELQTYVDLLKNISKFQGKLKSKEIISEPDPV